jgi:hypothetical protein
VCKCLPARLLQHLPSYGPLPHNPANRCCTLPTDLDLSVFPLALLCPAFLGVFGGESQLLGLQDEQGVIFGIAVAHQGTLCILRNLKVGTLVTADDVAALVQQFQQQGGLELEEHVAILLPAADSSTLQLLYALGFGILLDFDLLLFTALEQQKQQSLVEGVGKSMDLFLLAGQSNMAGRGQRLQLNAGKDFLTPDGQLAEPFASR